MGLVCRDPPLRRSDFNTGIQALDDSLIEN